MQRGAARGALFLDVVALPFITDLDRILEKDPPGSFGTYRNRLKLGGVKIVSDGSPQAKTAYFTTPYLTGGPNGETGWRGEPSFPPEVLNAMVKRCYDLKLQTFIHCNGDAAIDMVLKAHEQAAAGDLAGDRRTVGDPFAVRPPRPARQVRRLPDHPVVLHRAHLLLRRRRIGPTGAGRRRTSSAR